MEHEFLPCMTIIPEIFRGIKAWSQTIVGGAYHPVIKVQCRGPYFAERVFRSQAGNMR